MKERVKAVLKRIRWVTAVVGYVQRAGQSLKQRLSKLKPRLSQWRNMKSIKAVVSLLVIMPLVFLGGRACQPVPEWQTMGVTNFDSVHLSDTSATATPILRVNQVGIGKIAEFLDDGTAAFSVNDGGTISLTGALDLNGSELILDADGDTSMIASSDDIITVTVNLTSAYMVIGVGNLKVGDGSPTTAQDGEDAYVEGGFEVDGTSRLDGAAHLQGNILNNTGSISITDNLYVTGTADIRGNVSDGGGDFTVADNFVVTGTSDLQGDVSDSAGTFTVADNAAITGQADAEQLVVTGYTTQTNPIVVIENVTGTNVLLVDVNGYLGSASGSVTVNDDFVVTGTTDLQGNVSDSAGDFTVADTVVLTSTVDIYDDISSSSGPITIADNIQITGTSDLMGNIADSNSALTIADNVAMGGASDAEQLVVTGYTTQTGSIFVVENITGTDVFQVSDLGVILSDLGAVTINDLFVVQNTTDLQGILYDSNSDLVIADNLVVTQTLDVYNAILSTNSALSMTDNVQVTGTSDLQGNVSDSGGIFTIADDAHITGTRDAIQLSITGYTTQTTSLLVLEKDDGTDVLTVSRGGNVVISGTTDHQGALSDSNSDLTINDNVVVTGTTDLQGNVTDSSDNLVTINDAATVNEDFTVGETVRWTPIVRTITGVQTVHPTSTLYVWEPTSDVTVTIGTTGVEEGDILYFVNIHATSCITVVDTGAMIGGGDIGLHQDDAAMWVYAGAAWVHLIHADNS